MMNKIFIDTSFIIPIFKKNDKSRLIIEKNKDILFENECYISNGVLNEVITVVMMKTKNIKLTEKAYYFLNDNYWSYTLMNWRKSRDAMPVRVQLVAVPIPLWRIRPKRKKPSKGEKATYWLSTTI